MLPADMLALFSIDATIPGGAADFVELTHRIAVAWRAPCSAVGKPVARDIVLSMCKQRNMWYLAFYSRINAAVKPILSADDETLAALGIKLGKKRTSVSLAYALAELYISGLS